MKSKLTKFEARVVGCKSVNQIFFSFSLTKPYTSYRLHPFCNPSGYMRYPTNSDEVVAIVNYAKNRGVKVKAFGSRHSQSDIICTEGIPVDMTKLKLFRMEDDDVTATFGAGVTLGECGEFLFQHGRALKTTPAYSGITIGGAIGTGAHGSSVKYNSSLSAQVVRMTVVDGLGQKLVISDADDLKSFKTHLGLLGINFLIITQQIINFYLFCSSISTFRNCCRCYIAHGTIVQSLSTQLCCF